MRAHALRCLLWLGAVPRHVAVIVGDVGGLHSLRHAAASPPRARGVGLLRMEAAPFPQGDELPPQCGGALGRRPETAMTPVMQSSIEKGTFGGGSGGTATLDDTDFSVNTILKQLESIQQGTPKNIVILGTRHCSFLHQQIIELLSYALVLSDNHIFTSGATGTHAATIRGALRADNPDLLTVILPQTLGRQPREIRELLGQVKNVVQLGHDQLPLDAASRICNSELLSKGDQLIVFAFHDSNTLRETIEEAKAMSLLVTVLFLD
ncbi:hypothetical protein AB1Y20_004081 [Prymnesium parvum]|uniref:Uncharacterized protein n=1 Tax=Prymnesium parvum TaxID=97485 RepID=A0AB34J9I0_PRYPA